MCSQQLNRSGCTVYRAQCVACSAAGLVHLLLHQATQLAHLWHSSWVRWRVHAESLTAMWLAQSRAVGYCVRQSIALAMHVRVVLQEPRRGLQCRCGGKRRLWHILIGTLSASYSGTWSRHNTSQHSLPGNEIQPQNVTRGERQPVCRKTCPILLRRAHTAALIVAGWQAGKAAGSRLVATTVKASVLCQLASEHADGRCSLGDLHLD